MEEGLGCGGGIGASSLAHRALFQVLPPLRALRSTCTHEPAQLIALDAGAKAALILLPGALFLLPVPLFYSPGPYFFSPGPYFYSPGPLYYSPGPYSPPRGTVSTPRFGPFCGVQHKGGG